MTFRNYISSCFQILLRNTITHLYLKLSNPSSTKKNASHSLHTSKTNLLDTTCRRRSQMPATTRTGPTLQPRASLRLVWRCCSRRKTNGFRRSNGPFPRSWWMRQYSSARLTTRGSHRSRRSTWVGSSVMCGFLVTPQPVSGLWLTTHWRSTPLKSHV